MREAVQFRCATVDDAIHRVKALLARHVQSSEIEVISSEPIPELQSLITGKSRLPTFVILGALTGIFAGFSLAAGTAWLYPINTGGMPILSLLPVGIVSYETMMMFAVIFGLAGLLIETRKSRKTAIRSIKGQVPSDGEVLILVQLGQGRTAAEIEDIT